jgi:hypothetical protein
MEFFTDRYYKLDVENKLNHHQILFDSNGSFSGYTIIPEGVTISETYATNNAVVLVSNNIDAVHLYNTISKKYAQETKITNNAKKFVLE